VLSYSASNDLMTAGDGKERQAKGRFWRSFLLLASSLLPWIFSFFVAATAFTVSVSASSVFVVYTSPFSPTSALV